MILIDFGLSESTLEPGDKVSLASSTGLSRKRLLLLLLSRFSHVQLCATPWTAAYQAPLSMGFSRQEYWSGLPLPSLRKRLDNGIIL